MSICKISDIQSRVGTVIPSISGTIVSVFPAKEGKGQHGAWKLQNIKIKDEGGECSVTLSGLEESLQEFHKGKTIEFESVGTKFGLKGVSVEEREWEDKKTGQMKKTIGCKVTKTAKIRLEGAGMVQEDAKDDIPYEFQTEHKGTVKVTGEDSHDRQVSFNVPLVKDVKSPQERIAQFGKLYKLCYREAIVLADEFKTIETGSIKDIATTLFINGHREGLADKMEVDGKEPF